jgi:hypothetical protein
MFLFFTLAISYDFFILGQRFGFLIIQNKKIPKIKNEEEERRRGG